MGMGTSRWRFALIALLFFLLSATVMSLRFNIPSGAGITMVKMISASLALLSGATLTSSSPTPSAALRLNHIQVVGTHNSYHIEPTLRERPTFESYLPGPENYYYSHSTLSNQLTHQAVRSLELDLHSDEKGGLYYPPLIWKLANLTEEERPFDGDVLTKPGIKIFHVTDFDSDAVCHTFVDCLKELHTWSEANKNHIPILIDLELKTDAPACEIGGVCSGEATNWTIQRLLNVDAEILSVFSRDQLIVPDDLRKDDLTLEQSVLQHGWPLLNDVRGKFMFYFDNDPKPKESGSPREVYKSNGHESLQNRTVFTNALEGSEDCAFIKHNEPTGADLVEIQRLVKKGYIVRTRADVPLDTIIERNTTQRDSAFKSGAHIVSTDYPAYGMAARWGWDYAVELGKGKTVICNPISAPEGCDDGQLE